MERMAGVGGVVSHCNRNSVCPGAPAALTARGSSLTALGRQAARLWQLIHCRISCPPVLLGSLWPGFPAPLASPTLQGEEGG